MPSKNHLIKTAQRYLSEHDAKAALSVLKEALSKCGPEDRDIMTKILHYIGVSLYKVGFKDCAVKTWMSSKKITKRGPFNQFACRFTNEYGMLRQKHDYLNDWKAFYSIHIKRYLEQKNTSRFGSEAERDVVRQIIMEKWYELGDYAGFRNLNLDEKLILFRKARIVFPLTHTPSVLGDKIIEISSGFAQSSAVRTCFCGSGLAFHQCCGRIQAEEELILR